MSLSSLETRLSNRQATDLYSAFIDLAARQPNVEAILTPGRPPLCFAHFPARIEFVRDALHAAGLSQGDLVATALPNGADTAVCVVSLACCATVVPLNPEYSEDEFRRYLERLRPAALVVAAESGEIARAAATSLAIPLIELVTMPGEPCGTFTLARNEQGIIPRKKGWAGPDDTAFILLTSGSTGHPRFVPLKHRLLLTYADGAGAYYELGPTDRGIHVMPMFHGHGLKAALLNPLLAGGGVVCADRFDVDTFFASIEEFRPTWFSAGFAIHRAIVEGLDPFREKAKAAGLRFIRSGSGRLDRRVIAELESAFGAPVLERYGMSEAGTLTYNPLPPGIRKPGTVGIVGKNDVRIMDESGRFLAANEEGEVVARGATVVDGYWDDPEATAEAFVDGWFHTGDLGRFDHDGYLTITGRIKDLINRGGEKISPVEVESVLLEHVSVAEACVFPVPHQTLGQELAAAVVVRRSYEHNEEALLAFARRRLAIFKMPRRILGVTAIPRTNGGKVRRNELAQVLGLTGNAPALRPAGERSGSGRPALVIAVGGLWASMLGREAVDPDEDFFLLGGDSLSAIRLLGQVHEAFGTKLPLAAILDQASTVAGMARCIEQSRKQSSTSPVQPMRGNDDAAPIPRRDESLPCPLSFQQRRLWFLDQLHPGTSVYNLHSAISMSGPLSAEALGRALNTLVNRHESLRTTFALIDGEPCQMVAPHLEMPLPVRDLRDFPPEQWESATRDLLDAEVHRPFDLARGPLVRALLVKRGDEDHTLLLVQHHIVTDAWSRGIFQRELSILYDAFAQGADATLADLPIQYPDYSAWQRRTFAGPRLDGMLAYWRARLAGAPSAVTLPIDRRRQDRSGFAGFRLDRPAPTALVRAFFDLARREKTSPYFAWLAVFNAFLSRCSGDVDIVVGVPVQGRDRPETLGVVGFFVNMLPLRTDLSGDPSFRALLARVRKASAADLGYQHLPFERIVEDLQPDRRIGETPLFNTACVLLDDSSRATRDGWRRGSSDFDRGTVPFDLSLVLDDTRDGARLSFRYNSALFERATVERMASQFLRFLEAIVLDPDRPISAVSVLSPQERHEAVVTWNRTETDYPGGSLQTLFETRVDASPGATALSDGSRRLTYAELDNESNRLAHVLRGRGVTAGSVVGLCLERSIDAVVAVLAIVKAGGVYLPLDAKCPDGRRTFILADAQVALLITRSSIVPPPTVSVPTLYLDCLDELADQSTARVPGCTTSDDLAYVIYTSGSTGQPKGVAVRQRGVIRLVINTNYAAFSPSTVVGQVSNIAFDAATFEIWGALLNGGRLEILDDETVLRPEGLAAAISARGLTLMFLTTALFQQTARSKPDAFKGLETLLVGGDVADPTTFGLVLAAEPPARLVNIYGPTEATTFASFQEVKSVTADAVSIPIGKPIANSSLYVLGPHLQPEAVGIPGELYIGGPGVARGYVNLPELTARHFLLDPFSEKPGAVLYRTGDRARYRPDGSIEWLGRIDRQVKIRGFRVEPAEIEATLLRHPDVAQAAVVVAEGADGVRQLVAYVASRATNPAGDSGLRAFLRETLPDFMVPGAFVWLERLPLTSSGKVDRAALPRRATEPRRAPVTPVTPTEKAVAAIWAEHLGMDSVGTDDDFFDLGGHSLLAVKLVTSLESRFGVSLPLASLFGTPTVAALAAAIDERRDAKRSSRVITMQPLGRKVPIFALPGGGGSVIAYGLLARALGNAQPFYGLEHPGLENGEVPPDRVEAVAAGFLEDIRDHHPNQPCVLIGACSGGIVAFELARLLEAEGRPVARVVLLDPSRIGPRRSRTGSSLWRQLVIPRFVLRRLTSYVRDFKRLEGDARWAFVTAKRERLVTLVRQPETIRDTARDINRDRIREATVAALQHYVPQPYAGSVALILGDRFDATADGSRWRSVCSGQLDVLRMPGSTSGEMLRPPLLEHLVGQLQSVLS